ncbi:MAG TPA: hypothetical protein VJB60_02555 [Candidatus Peribacterales bacterium]|nr:hypothetical protein [Candidatus Peribacterales bacterium]
MRFAFLTIILAFGCGLSVSILTQNALTPQAYAGSVEDGLEYFDSLIALPTATSDDVRDIIVDVIKFILSFLSLIAVIMIIIAGFYLILGAGTEASVTHAKKIILYTIIGLIVIFFARVIVGLFTQELPKAL